MDQDEAMQELWRLIRRAVLDFTGDRDLNLSLDPERREARITLPGNRYTGAGDQIVVKVEKAWS